MFQRNTRRHAWETQSPPAQTKRWLEEPGKTINGIGVVLKARFDN